MPNDHGRVIGDEGQPVDRVYVTGWIKRGPRGVIGTNRACAEETATKVWADYAAGKLDRPVADRDALMDLMAERAINPINWNGWRAIDAAEQKRGVESSRPRVKFVCVTEALAAI